MIGLDEIATTGSPALVSALGMGTVFACLTILYLLMRLLGRTIPRMVASSGRAASTEARASASENGPEELSPTEEARANDEEGIAAAITIALARHRSSRLTSVSPESRGGSPWKMAGRARALRRR
jgi:sodium pump decarboxylase gamma subunit